MANWPGDTLDLQSVSNARAQRQRQSNETNPEYSLSDVGYLFNVAESAALLSIIGNKTSQTTPKKWVDYLFGKLYNHNRKPAFSSIYLRMNVNTRWFETDTYSKTI